MPDLIFLASRELVMQPEGFGDPAEGLPSLHCHGIHNEARAQLYSMISGNFLDEARQLEILTLFDEGDGPLVYELDPTIVTTLASVDEDRIESIVAYWQETTEVEELQLPDSDLGNFLFGLVNLCQTAGGDDELSVFVLSEG